MLPCPSPAPRQAQAPRCILSLPESVRVTVMAARTDFMTGMPRWESTGKGGLHQQWVEGQSVLQVSREGGQSVLQVSREGGQSVLQVGREGGQSVLQVGREGGQLVQMAVTTAANEHCEVVRDGPGLRLPETSDDLHFWSEFTLGSQQVLVSQLLLVSSSLYLDVRVASSCSV
ncbi:hypothetical protein E2C01_007935 [Portunus trituberculatus]|uniref:Uncharacterized protein n=1 Tax=Portunus trituberculatus TaxID=210409 RepID=A0A5B7CZG3_PORTR|nr:hypothetical protein [Portunus trituberculatus]